MVRFGWRTSNDCYTDRPMRHKSFLPLTTKDVPPKRERLSLSGPKEFLWWIVLLMEVFIYGSYSVLVHLCEEDRKLPFSSSSVVFMTEVFKILISIVCFIPEVCHHGIFLPPPAQCFFLIVPAFLYCINNNIAYHVQLEMDPTSFQVLSNLKIASTAVLYRIIIKRDISMVQWFALTLLTVAGILDSYGGMQEKSSGIIHVTTIGLIMMFVYCFISGFAGVSTEYILKKHFQTSLHLQNIVLYMYGILMNGCVWLFQVSSQTRGQRGHDSFFQGFSVYTWIIVISQAFNGLIMSAIMKHGSNIIRMFFISCAMLVTTFLSVVIFELKLNICFIIAFILVIIALILYHNN